MDKLSLVWTIVTDLSADNVTYTSWKGDGTMNQIKKLRKKQGDTLRELAKKIDYDYSNLSKIERGIMTPSLKILGKIAAVYDMKIEDFFKDDDDYLLYGKETRHELEISAEDLLCRYNVLLDGKPITEFEAEFLVSLLRTIREASIFPTESKNPNRSEL